MNYVSPLRRQSGGSRYAAAPLQKAAIPSLRFGQDYCDELLDISEFGYDCGLAFCEDLAREVGVGAVPGSSFFRKPVSHLIRLHFAKRDETLHDALNRLESLRQKLPRRK